MIFSTMVKLTGKNLNILKLASGKGMARYFNFKMLNGRKNSFRSNQPVKLFVKAISFERSQQKPLGSVGCARIVRKALML